jgi:GNAT superfamily N-acetyltransferase
MYITIIYSKIDNNQKKKIFKFLMDNFENQYNFSLEDNTIIIIDITDTFKILACICLLNNKYLKKIINNNILKYYTIDDKLNGSFIYNFCVDKNERNKKIGTKILNYTIEKMKDINIDYLHAHITNNISKNIFLKYNFIEDNNYIGSNNEIVYSMLKYI